LAEGFNGGQKRSKNLIKKSGEKQSSLLILLQTNNYNKLSKNFLCFVFLPLFSFVFLFVCLFVVLLVLLCFCWICERGVVVMMVICFAEA